MGSGKSDHVHGVDQGKYSAKKCVSISLEEWYLNKSKRRKSTQLFLVC